MACHHPARKAQLLPPEIEGSPSISLVPTWQPAFSFASWSMGLKCGAINVIISILLSLLPRRVQVSEVVTVGAIHIVHEGL